MRSGRIASLVAMGWWPRAHSSKRGHAMKLYVMWRALSSVAPLKFVFRTRAGGSMRVCRLVCRLAVAVSALSPMLVIGVEVGPAAAAPAKATAPRTSVPGFGHVFLIVGENK